MLRVPTQVVTVCVRSSSSAIVGKVDSTSCGPSGTAGIDRMGDVVPSWVTKPGPIEAESVRIAAVPGRVPRLSSLREPGALLCPIVLGGIAASTTVRPLAIAQRARCWRPSTV